MRTSAAPNAVRLSLAGLLALSLILAAAPRMLAEYPYPSAPPGTDPYDYGAYLFIEPGGHPNDWQHGDRWELASDLEADPDVCGPDDPPECWAEELYGVTGISVDRAWELTTGRPDVILAVLDCGIRWTAGDLIRKLHLNTGELPLPEGAESYDTDANGAVDIRDYYGDSRVYDANGNGVIDPGDLIEIFSDGVDGDVNGYTDDICGWDFFEEDNQPFDDVDYGHGTGIAADAAAEVNNGGGPVGVCPNCQIMPVRIGDSFIVDTNDFARGVAFAADTGAAVIGAAIGGLSNTAFAQQAVDYAYRRGVLLVTSAADEASIHHNMPSDHPHCLLVNAVTQAERDMTDETSYIMMSGCTNHGARIDTALSTSSCSSGATGRGTGALGLVYSAAKTAEQAGTITNYPLPSGGYAPWVLSANEALQIIRTTADDIHTEHIWEYENYYWPSERFHAHVGWDPYFGFGRVNVRAAVERVMSGAIPPEASLDGPGWWTILDPAWGTVALTGAAGAQRSTSFGYEVYVAPMWDPYPDDFIMINEVHGLTGPVEGWLADLDLTWLAALMPHGVEGTPDDPTSRRGDPNRFAFTVKLIVTDADGRTGVSMLGLFLHHDPDLDGMFPIALNGDGASAPLFVDLDRDGAQELLIGSGTGHVHAYRHTGGELPGWPVTVDPLEVPLSSPAFSSGEIVLPVHGAILLGAPAVGDLDNDGTLEVVAADLEGKVYVWSADGVRRPGFPVSTNRAYSAPRRPDGSYARDRYNRKDWGISSAPALADLDGDGALEIIVTAHDAHVYAWRHDGIPLPGWPVLVAEPAYVRTVEPGTHHITLTTGGQSGLSLLERKILGGASIGDLDGDGSPDVVVTTVEAYNEPRNMILTPLEELLLEQLGADMSGNSRIYALYADGTLHDGDPGDDDGLDPDAFLPGWPARTAMLGREILPTVGSGTGAAAVLADLDNDGDDEVIIHTSAGPGHIVDGDGSSFLGEQGGLAITLPRQYEEYGAAANSTDSPSFCTFGGPALLREDDEIFAAAPGGGVGRLAEVGLAGDQENSDGLLLGWTLNASECPLFLEGFPREVNDMPFFVTPSGADLNNDALIDVIMGTGVYDLHAVNRLGQPVSGWPKLTGGWVVSPAAVGDFQGDGFIDVAAATREGNVFLWRTQGHMSGNLSWPGYQHDRHNTGNLRFHTPTLPTLTPTVEPSGTVPPATATPTPVVSGTPHASATPQPTAGPSETPPPFTGTPTPVPPTRTPSPTRTPTPSPTWPPSPTFTPELTATPTPPPELGLRLIMPAEYFVPGSACSLTAEMGNPDETFAALLFVALYVADSYWFYPSWELYYDGLPLAQDHHYVQLHVPPGVTVRQIIPEFAWPEVDHALSGIQFLGAMVDPLTNELIGELTGVTFSYGPR